MPKMKSHRGAAKRFKVTGAGKLRRERAYRSHLKLNKSSRRLRRLRGRVPVAAPDAHQVRKQLGR